MFGLVALLRVYVYSIARNWGSNTVGYCEILVGNSWCAYVCCSGAYEDVYVRVMGVVVSC